MTHSCPFCNHSFEAEPAARLICPRCDEYFSPRSFPADGPRPPTVTADHERPPPTVMENRWRFPLMALFTLSMIAVSYWYFSRKPEQLPLTVPPEPITQDTTPPSKLLGLNFLPRNANVVFAIQPGPLLAYAERTKQDPVELLTRNRIPASILGTLAKAGVPLQNIDHVAGGLYVPERNESLSLGFVLVLRQRLPDEKAFLEALKAVPAPNLGQGRFIVSFGNFSLHAYHATETAWVFNLREQDFSTNTPLSSDLAEVIRERVPPDSAIWAAAASEKWHEKPFLLALGKEMLGPLEKGRAGAFGYSFGERPTLTLAVRTTDARLAEEVRGRFRGLATGEHSESGGTGEWATLARPIDPADLFTTVRRMLGE